MADEKKTKKKNGHANRTNLKINWIKIKGDYLADPLATYKSLGEKYKVPAQVITNKAAKDRWSFLRKDIQSKVDVALAKRAENELLEIKDRHMRIAKLMQKLGLEALEDENFIPKSSKEARAFLVEGIRIERELSGLDKQDKTPAIVNIINEQEKIIGQYSQPTIEGEVVEDGKE